MKLTWHNTNEDVIVRVEEMVKRDVELLDCENPGSLVFHHVFLTRDYDGPSVFVWGIEGDDSFHCEYSEKTVWKTAAEFDAEQGST